MTAAATLGFRAIRGGAVLVGVAVEGPEPRILLSTFLATAAEGDRLAYEPYHVAYEMVRGQGEAMEKAAAVVAEARRRQDVLAAERLAAILEQMQAAGRRPVAAALLINRAGWMTDLLQHGLSAPEHPPVMEGLAVREALRFAGRRCGLPLVEMDEKTLDEAASIKLGRSPAEIGAALAALGASAGRPWRKEQKLACLAAWVAAAAA